MWTGYYKSKVPLEEWFMDSQKSPGRENGLIQSKLKKIVVDSGNGVSASAQEEVLTRTQGE